MTTALTNCITAQLDRHAPAAQGIAVALSGGADSWALTLLTRDYCAEKNIPFIALTVDHRLRFESTAEAAQVKAECVVRKIPHEILVWQHDGIESRKQERAREARYQLLADYCTAHNFTHLLTAHHKDDQVETVLMRFAKASGTTGLAGLSPARSLHGITLLRPLLEMSKTDLIAYVEFRGITYINDPSNENKAFARVRLRQSRDVLAQEGLTTESLIKTAVAARIDSDALHFATHELILKHAYFCPSGTVTLQTNIWQTAPLGLQLIAWQSIWRYVTGDDGYAPNRDDVQASCTRLNDSTGHTLGGMQIQANTKLVFAREAAAIKPVTVPAYKTAIFDNRFEITNNTNAPVDIVPLKGGVRQVLETHAPWALELANRQSIPAFAADFDGKSALLPLPIVGLNNNIDNSAIFARYLRQIPASAPLFSR